MQPIGLGLRIVSALATGFGPWIWGFSAFGAPADVDDVHVVRSRRTGLATFVASKIPDGIAVRGVAVGAVPRPIDFLGEHGWRFGVADAPNELVLRGERKDQLGQTHTTFDQVFHGVPVFSGVLNVHQDAAGRFIAANGHFHPILPTLSVVPSLSERDAAASAASKSSVVSAAVELSQLVVVDPGWYGDPSVGAHLAYYVIRSDPARAYREAFFVDAHTGFLLDRWSLVESAMDRRIYNGLGTATLPGILVRGEGDPPAGAAIDLAIDRKRFADIYYAGFSKPACLPYPDFSPGYFEDQAKRCEFNLDKAKKLLNEAGITSLDVTMTVSGPALYPGSDVLAEVMNADLKKIGVNLKIENLPQAQARPKILTAKDYQMAGHLYGRANKDPATMFGGTTPYLTDCEQNITRYCSDRYKKLVEEAAATLQPEKRKTIFREINDFLFAEKFCLPVAPNFIGFVKRKNVHGFGVNLDGYCILEETWLA